MTLGGLWFSLNSFLIYAWQIIRVLVNIMNRVRVFTQIHILIEVLREMKPM